MRNQSRKKKLMLNTLSALIKQIITLICGFILPRFILTYYGSATNGLITSVTQFLGFITFLEMGIGPVIQSNLYKPLARNDELEISKIVKASEKFFRKIAFAFLVYICILLFAFPAITDAKFDVIFTDSLLLIISISTFAQYYCGITYQLLLNADQKAYVQLILQTLTIVVNTVFSVIMIKCGASIQAVKLMTAIVYLARPMGQILYVKKHYRIDKSVAYDGEPIQQKWNGFIQHIAAVVVTNTDIVILSVFNTLESVSVYSVYFTVVNGINTMVMTLATGLESLWGNMIANKEYKELINSFEAIEFVAHGICISLFTITGLLIVPFIEVYTNGIDDTNYIIPLFAILIVTAYGFQCLRIPYFRMIKAAGHYKQTQIGSLIEMIINIVISIIFVFKFGINGVAVGTLLAMGYHTIYFVRYLRNNIINRSAKYFIKHLFVDSICIFFSVLVSQMFEMKNVSYISWGVLALKITIPVLAINVLIQCAFYRKNIMSWLRLLK